MRVEGPQTFMTAYQQGRQNRRQDEQDNQKLAFSIFGEKRARDKHDAFIDRAEEDTRAAKTMNPLMESLRLYENQLKFNTLDSSISRHREKTRADKQEHILSEAKKRSDLDYSTYSRGQDSSQYGYGTATTEKQQEKIDTRRGLMDKVVEGGLRETDTLQGIDADLNNIDALIARETGKQFTDTVANDPDRLRELASGIINNNYINPTLAKTEDYNKLFDQFGIDKRSRNYQGQLLDLGDARIKNQKLQQDEIDRLTIEEQELFDAGNNKKARDVSKRIEMLTKTLGLLQGGNMQDVLGGGR